MKNELTYLLDYHLQRPVNPSFILTKQELPKNPIVRLPKKFYNKFYNSLQFTD